MTFSSHQQALRGSASKHGASEGSAVTGLRPLRTRPVVAPTAHCLFRPLFQSR